jgi:kinesin family protein 2/24
MGPVVEAIEKIRKDREARRRSAQFKRAEASSAEGGGGGGGGGGGAGAPVGRVDRDTAEFVRMIRAFREENSKQAQPQAAAGEHSIAVVVRKRPMNAREAGNGDYDAVTCLNPRAIVHAPKKKVDGITRYLENTAFQFDHTFDETCDTPAVYRATVEPLVDFAFRRGRGTCFAYGQTGSGKTHTMSGIQELVAADMFARLNAPEARGKLELHASFFEIYGGRAFDVLHDRHPVLIREDEKHRVVASGLKEVVCRSIGELQLVIAQGNASRTTHSTEVNAGSSRSHAICELSLRGAGGAGGGKAGAVHGSLTLIDLAGSERAADSRNHVQARRIESAEINTSLLALKECIRALAVRAASAEGAHVHVPFRASKLTLALRDSFESAYSRVVMIATVSPCASSWDHTGNTLRYADRVKEQPGAMEFDEEGRLAGGGGGGGGGCASARAPVGKSYSFAAADSLGSGAEAAAGDGRASPPAGEDVITGAKAPPKPIFRREQIAAARAAAEAEEDAAAAAAAGTERRGGKGAKPPPPRAAPPAPAPPPPLPPSAEGRAVSVDAEDRGLSEGDFTPTPAVAALALPRGSLLSPPLRVPATRAPPPPPAPAQAPVPRTLVTGLKPPSSRGAAARGAAGVTEDAPPAPAPDDRLPLPPPSTAGMGRLMQRGALGHGGEEEPPAQPAAGDLKARVIQKFASKGRAQAPPGGGGGGGSGGGGGGGAPTRATAAPAAQRVPASRARRGPDENVEPGAPSRDESLAEEGNSDGTEGVEGGEEAGGGGGGVAARAAVASAPARRAELVPSPQQADIRALHTSVRREEGGDGEDLLALHEAVGMIVDLEQELMDAHLNSIQVRRRAAVYSPPRCAHTHTPHTHTHTHTLRTPTRRSPRRRMRSCSRRRASCWRACRPRARARATRATTTCARTPCAWRRC